MARLIGRVDFLRVLREVITGLNGAGVRYALIGGFAMSLRGVQRATADLDFILLLRDLGAADAVLTRHGYQRVFHSENVSHYESPDRAWGRIDLLHAFRRPSLGMLERAEAIMVASDLSLPVARSEDLIGLKVQALVNNPARADGDWRDIRSLIVVARESGLALDWELIADYLRLFGLEPELARLKET